MTADVETESHLLPDTYVYAYWAQYLFLLLGIILVSDLLVNLVLNLFALLGGEARALLNGRELTDIVAGLCALTLAGLCYQYRTKVLSRIGKWTKFSFAAPISIETPVINTTGDSVVCRFSVELDLWFEDADAADEARQIEDKIVSTLQLFLEEASRDPVARRSKTYFREWIEEAFRMPKVVRIDVKSTDFRPI